MKEKINKIIRYVLSAAFAGLLLWFSFRDVEWDEFLAVLKECRWVLAQGYTLAQAPSSYR